MPGRNDNGAFEDLRERMVRTQLTARGITDRGVLEAMRTVPRERFVPPDQRGSAYEDRALAIEEGQTISQPYVVALMCELLKLGPEDRVLEVGAGSGYAAAVMGRIAREVIGVERHPRLVELTRERVRNLGYANVRIEEANGSRGWPAGAPYDAISVAAGGPSIGDEILEQLALGGRLVMPVGPSRRSQELVRVTRTAEGGFERESLGEVRFVPLIGAGAWPERRGGEVYRR